MNWDGVPCLPLPAGQAGRRHGTLEIQHDFRNHATRPCVSHVVVIIFSSPYTLNGSGRAPVPIPSSANPASARLKKSVPTISSSQMRSHCF
jgi:hypothetical protein